MAATNENLTAALALLNALGIDPADLVSATSATTPAPKARKSATKAKAAKPATCGAPTASGGTCSRKAEGGFCKQHTGKTAAEWRAHHERVAAEREVAKAEYLARKERGVTFAVDPKRTAANHAAAAICKAKGLSNSGDEWRAIRDALLAQA